jgi:hypothetical protein
MEGLYTLSFKEINSGELLFEFEIDNVYVCPYDETINFKVAWNQSKLFDQKYTFLRGTLKMKRDGESYFEYTYTLKKQYPEQNVEIICKPVNRLFQIWKTEMFYTKGYFMYELIKIRFDDNWQFVSSNLKIEEAHLLVEKIAEYPNEEEEAAKYRLKSLKREAESIYNNYLNELAKVKKEELRIQISNRVKIGEDLYSVFEKWYENESYCGVFFKKYNSEGRLEWIDDPSENPYNYKHIFGPETLENCQQKQREVDSIRARYNSDEFDRQRDYDRYEDEGRYYSGLRGD